MDNQNNKNKHRIINKVVCRNYSYWSQLLTCDSLWCATVSKFQENEPLQKRLLINKFPEDGR